MTAVMTCSVDRLETATSSGGFLGGGGGGWLQRWDAYRTRGGKLCRQWADTSDGEGEEMEAIGAEALDSSVASKLEREVKYKLHCNEVRTKSVKHAKAVHQ